MIDNLIVLVEGVVWISILMPILCSLLYGLCLLVSIWIDN
jgi:hypothetical protein